MFGLGPQDMLTVANSPAGLLCIGTIGALLVVVAVGVAVRLNRPKSGEKKER